MSSMREMRLRIRSVKNIAQVTRALETVSASKVRKATQAVIATRPYSENAWKVLIHLVRQPGGHRLHPLLSDRNEIRKTLILLISSDRGLAGSYNVNIVRQTLIEFSNYSNPVVYVTVGRKGRDMLLRRNRDILAEFNNLPSPPTFMDVSAIGRLVVDDFLRGMVDEVYLAYTQFKSMVQQIPVIQKLLPLEVIYGSEFDRSINVTHHHSNAVFIYEPDQSEVLNQTVPRFTALQIYQAILSAQASEHAARMVAMRNASDNARELIASLQLEYNKVRQQMITNDLLDIVGGANALTQSALQKINSNR
jgi:F-type H+-transporting ATPase subunit gamma